LFIETQPALGALDSDKTISATIALIVKSKRCNVGREQEELRWKVLESPSKPAVVTG
jgi:hypothetical protein